MNKHEAIQQTKLAFDFLQKLYYEVSYLIKEVEGQLAEEQEQFILGKPGGYQVTSRGSSGLDITLVKLWLMRFMSVFFVADESTVQTGGRTTSKFENNLKVIFLRFVLDDKDISEPYIYAGVVYDFVEKHRQISKFEEFIRHMEYNDSKIFTDGLDVDYADSYISFKAKFQKVNLFDINSSEDISRLVIGPALALYRMTN